MEQSLIYGHDASKGIVGAELCAEKGSPDRIKVYVRSGDSVETEDAAFSPFMLAAEEDLFEGAPAGFRTAELQGKGRYCLRVEFDSWADLVAVRKWLTSRIGRGISGPDSPVFFLNDPVQQYLLISGRTFFRGMAFGEVKRMQCDIETYTEKGFEFSNAARESDKIIAIALGDDSGKVEVLCERDGGEKKMLKRFVELVKEWDPDVIEGHNIFNFDLPYIQARAKMHGVRLKLGRDGSVARSRSSQFPAGERMISYTRFEIHGRSITDTYFMAQLYDLSSRSIESFGLKNLALHFGVTPPGRTYIEGPEIAETYRKDPDRLLKYAADDIHETRELSNILSPVYFNEATMLPFSFQNVCVRGNGAKIDALLLREYLRAEAAVPAPEPPRKFAGGYTDIFEEGVIRNVHHCDIRSLYPSLMLAGSISPASDELGVFAKTLEFLRSYRLDAKERMRKCADPAARNHLDALQSAYKILINSFYGYLGFRQGHFNDFDAAERVTAEGRKLLASMVDWLKEHDGVPVEIDTDGIYFVPPESMSSQEETEKFREDFARSLPEGIEVEFDGEYQAMFSYKMKNYALLDKNGEMTIKGAALKSRGLEPFLRDFLSEILMLKLTGCEDRLESLRDKYASAIEKREIEVSRLAKTETLRDAPSTYADKIAKGGRGKNAAYELALKSEREYRAGDQVSYYITGTRKSVTAHAAAKLLSDHDPEERDENIAYYVSKLDSMFKKFT